MRLPPALNVALLTTLSLLAGCVEPVEDGGDPDLDALAREAQDAVTDLTDESGHVAGQVVDAAGAAIAGAHVVLDDADAVETDDQGRFAFVDVTPGDHVLAAPKAGYLDSGAVAVPVAAQSIARPTVVLAEDLPPAYFETSSFTFYDQASLFGASLGCDCYADLPVADGITEAVLEVVDEGGLVLTQDYHFLLTSYGSDENGTTYLGQTGGYVAPGWPALIGGEPLANATGVELRVAPDTLGAAQAYTAYLTLFYYGPAPDGFTAIPA